RFCLIESGLVRAWIDCEKQIAFLHVGAVLKVAPDYYPAHLRLQLHGLVRCTCADLIQVKRHVLCNDFGDTRRTRRRLSSLNLAGPVLKNPVSDKPCQKDEKQVRPFGNPLAGSTGAFRLRPRRRLGRAVIQCLMMANRGVSFHLNPSCEMPFSLESNLPVWAGRCARGNGGAPLPRHPTRALLLSLSPSS